MKGTIIVLLWDQTSMGISMFLSWWMNKTNNNTQSVVCFIRSRSLTFDWKTWFCKEVKRTTIKQKPLPVVRVLKINCSDDDDDNRNSAYLTSDGGRLCKSRQAWWVFALAKNTWIPNQLNWPWCKIDILLMQMVTVTNWFLL